MCIRDRNGPSLSVSDLNNDGLEDLFISGNSTQEEVIFFQNKKGEFKKERVSFKSDNDLLEEDAGVFIFDFENDGDNDVYIARGSTQYPAKSNFYKDVLFINDGTGNFFDYSSIVPVENSNSTCVKGADFDNDGDLDLYVANGHLSGNSALDYCTRFWCHDVYTGTSKPNQTLDTFFSGKLSGLGSNYSWNGFEHNHLFLNKQNSGFHNVAFLLGTAFEFDARAVVTADIDVDGRNDLLVVQYDSHAKQQRLFVMKNQMPAKGNWIGLHITDSAGQPANGATVQLFAGKRRDIVQLVTGDSFTAQHPSTAHFGLGENGSVDKLVIRWPSGKTKTLDQPATGKYHTVTP